jgi:hypothetical protein
MTIKKVYVTPESLEKLLENLADDDVKLSYAIGQACVGITQLLDEGWTKNPLLAVTKTEREVRLTAMSWQKQVKWHSDKESEPQLFAWQTMKFTKKMKTFGNVPRLCLFAKELNELVIRKQK